MSLAALLANSCTSAKKVATPPSPAPATATATATPAEPSPSATAAASPSPSPAVAAPQSPAAPAPSAPAPTSLAVPALHWTPCDNGFQCSSIAVPEDWSHPVAGPTVKLALIRLQASGSPSERIGSLLVNPGGPGGSAVDFVQQIKDVLPNSILRRFDIVGFDPRGVGSSEALNCESGPALDRLYAMNAPTSPSDSAGIAALQADNAQFAAGCLKEAGAAFLAHVDTLDAARDMDFIRQAVGDPKLTYIGYSYGTFLGAMYAQLFPTHVRALVLDGAVDPAVAPLTFDIVQAQGFDNELQTFFNQCTGCNNFAAGGSVRQGFLNLEAQITASPIPVGNRQLTQALFLNGVADALYSVSSWGSLSSALQQAAKGNGAALLAMSDDLTERNSNGTYNSISSAGPAIDCVDGSFPKDLASYEAAAAQAAQAAPIFGPSNVWSSLLCANWPVPSPITAGAVTAAGAPPILVVATTGDPATPYQEGVALAKELSSGVLLTHVGQGHTSLGQLSTCVQNTEATYVINLAAPSNGAVCSGSATQPSPSP